MVRELELDGGDWLDAISAIRSGYRASGSGPGRTRSLSPRCFCRPLPAAPLGFCQRTLIGYPRLPPFAKLAAKTERLLDFQVRPGFV
jgi:hypothetical protein